jgi:hypothetical protein
MSSNKLACQIFKENDYFPENDCNDNIECKTPIKNDTDCETSPEKITEEQLLANLETLKQNLVNAPVIHLNNSNFTAGTYRIRSSGTYILDEDLVFNPTGTSGQPPGVGWFAAIGVETDNVIIDLNGHTMTESMDFANAHIANVYAHIELDNSPFAGNAQGVGFAAAGSTYPGETKFVSASNVWIKNGTLALSGHWGIHGNNNSGIFLDNLRIYDWEVAGLTLNGLTNSYFNNLDISGSQHLITVKALPLNIALIQEQLAGFGTTGPIGEQAVIINNNLTTFLQNNQSIYTPLPFPDGSVYGILIAGGSPFSAPFPLDTAGCAEAIADTNGTKGKNIIIKNTNIHDILASPLETIAIGSNNGGFLSLLTLGVFGMLRYDDLFDSAGNYNPNSLAIANAFVALQNLNANPNLAGNFPPNLNLILEAIVTNNSALFYANGIPIFGRNFMSSVLTGVFGFRIDCSAQDVFLINCSTNSIINVADPPIQLADIPGASNYPNLVPDNSSGAECWGFEFSAGNNVIVSKSTANNIRSDNDDAFGFDLISSDTNIVIKDCIASNIYGFGDILPGPSEAYGFRVRDNITTLIPSTSCPFAPQSNKSCPFSGKVKDSKCQKTNGNLIYNCTAYNIFGKRIAFGFSNESSGKTIINKSEANTIVATSSLQTQSLTIPKSAYGFSSDSGLQNTFMGCVATQVSISGENELTAPSTSVAAGYALLNTDNGTKILCCSANNGETGAGVYTGILIQKNVVNEEIKDFCSSCNNKTAVYGQIHKILRL